MVVNVNSGNDLNSFSPVVYFEWENAFAIHSKVTTGALCNIELIFTAMAAIPTLMIVKKQLPNQIP